MQRREAEGSAAGRGCCGRRQVKLGRRHLSAMAPVTARSGIVPVVPANPTHFAQLEEDLERMGCEGFLRQAWNLKHVPMLEELLLDEVPAGYKKTLRAQPTKWTLDVWRAVYGFARGGEGMATRKEDCTRGKFQTKPHRNDGYRVTDCKDEREMRVLAFLVPILHPEKPTACPANLASTILSSYAGHREVSWTRIVRDLVSELVKALGNRTPSPLCPFLFHLYQHSGVLLPEEAEIWQVQQERRRKGMEDDHTEEEGSGESAEMEEEPSRKRKRVASPFATPAGRTRSKLNPDTRKLQFPDISGNSLLPLIDSFRTRVGDVETVLQELVKLAGGCPLSKLVSTLKSGLTGAQPSQKLEKQVASLTSEVSRLKNKLKKSEEECQRAKERANESARALMAVEDVIGTPGEVFLKAKLWDSKVGQDERISRSKAVNFITTYAAKIENVLQDMRVVVGGISFALGARGSSSDPSQSASASKQEATAKGKEVVMVETSDETYSTPKVSEVPKSMSSVGGKEAASTLKHLGLLPVVPTPLTIHWKNEADLPTTSIIGGAPDSELHPVLGQQAENVVSKSQVEALSVRPRETLRKVEGLVSGNTDPDILPDINLEIRESMRGESERKQMESNVEEEVEKDQGDGGSIFATTAPMPPRKVRQE